MSKNLPEMLNCSCGRRFRTLAQEAYHRHNFPIFCKPKRSEVPLSVCNKVRRALKIKGSTEHNGRGVYEMDYDIDSDELKARLIAVAEKWKNEGELEKDLEISDDKRMYTLVFKKETTTSGYYCTLRLVDNLLKVCM